jgi:ADP-ribose pyrophosphatase YjhB (NUDIX family)
MEQGAEAYDYDGALVVVETGDDHVVFIHPPGADPSAPASFPSDPCLPGESPEDGAVRIVKEKTGLDVQITREFTTFIQKGTPTGTMLAHGYVARVLGGTLLDAGPEGPARAYPVSALPAIVPVRVANQRTLQAYLEDRAGS